MPMSKGSEKVGRIPQRFGFCKELLSYCCGWDAIEVGPAVSPMKSRYIIAGLKPAWLRAEPEGRIPQICPVEHSARNTPFLRIAPCIEGKS